MRNRYVSKGIKRTFDLFSALFLGIIFAPIWCLIALIIKFDSKGPIFFTQERPGFHRQLFKIYKFRTMQIGSEKMIKGQEVMKNDARITNVGQFLRRSKLDEIPQILNVIKGEMSLIGPRPERVESLLEYTDEISKRLDMRPGLTGLAQVKGNIYLPLEKRYQYDVYYVEHFSIWLDIKIIFQTIGVVLLGERKFAKEEDVK